MELVKKKDLLRVMLLASSVFLVISTFYAFFLHAQYTSQINQIRIDLLEIKKWYDGKAENAKGPGAAEFKQIANEAEKLANLVSEPRMNPYVYVYLNYWLTSAAFVDISPTYFDLGLKEETVSVLLTLEKNGWFGDPKLRMIDEQTGNWVQRLKERPRPPVAPWLYYILVIAVVLVSAYLGVREKYETRVIPEVISGAVALIPFWAVYFLGTMIALGLGVISPEQVTFEAYLVDVIVTVILSAFAGALAGIIKHRREI